MSVRLGYFPGAGQPTSLQFLRDFGCVDLTHPLISIVYFSALYVIVGWMRNRVGGNYVLLSLFS